LYSSKHILNLDSDGERYLYSAFGSLMFNFGSILFWCICKVYLPENDALRLPYAFASAATIMYIGRSYLKVIDGE
jgi:hypothetical protein